MKLFVCLLSLSIFIFLYFAIPFFKHNYFECVNSLFLFIAEKLPCCMDILKFVYQFIFWGMVDFLFLAIANKNGVHIGV